MSEIGFIGLGHMGAPMARNLLKTGHRLRVFDTVAAASAELEQLGAYRARDVADVARSAEIVITMLPAGAHVRDVYLGAKGLIASAADGALLIDSSTIDVETAREVAAQAQAAGLAMLDAPVSGGVAGAEAASLTFMVGGEAKDFSRASPILAAMGKNIFHAGASGNGQAAKLCNNMLLGISMIGVCETFALGEKLGMDARKLFEILSTASGQCWSLTSYCPVPGPVPASPANRDYQAGFTAAMMLKDLRLAQQAAGAAEVETPLGAHAQALYSRMNEVGAAGLDFSGIIKMLRKEI